MSPVRTGIVEKVSDYIHSSVSNYVYGSGLVEIEKTDNPIVPILKSYSFTKYNCC